MQIYLDHAASSFPKAPGVGEAMADYIGRIGVNVSRSTYAAATTAETAVLETRELLCRLFHFSDPTHAVFTPGQTYGLNYILKGLLKPGDRVLCSAMEHNAVMRPLMQLQETGVVVDRVPCRADGSMDPAAFSACLSAGPRPALAVMTHASNVSGTMLPVREIGALCAGADVPLVLDAAQTAGQFPIDFAVLRLSALCVPGHKGLLGPQGVGAMLLREDLARRITPLIAGGTGSASDSEYLPPYMPDRFESGTLNLPAIYGLRHALEFLLDTGIDTLQRQNAALTARFLDGLWDSKNLRIAGPGSAEERAPVVSIDFLTKDNADVAYRLERDYGICTRCGLHCAPSAHKTLGTFPQGTVRFSFGYGNTEAEIDLAVEAVRRLSEG